MTSVLNMEETSYTVRSEADIRSEMDLVKAAQRDPRDFALLYDRYYRTILAFVYHRLESKDDAFDVTAQVFYKAIENLGKYQARGVPFSAWLFRIASNELNALFKKKKNIRMVSIDDEGLGELKTGIDEGIAGTTDEELYNAIALLPGEDVELIDMRFFEKRPFKEIAAILEINESACKLRVYRLMEKLRELLKKESR
jgi:RNA polymerase sigma-70 factor (ECF subfamily)